MTLRQTENVQLISLDPYNVFLISFKEVKRAREKGRKNEKVRESVYFLSFMSVITVLNIISENFFMWCRDFRCLSCWSDRQCLKTFWAGKLERLTPEYICALA